MGRRTWLVNWTAKYTGITNNTIWHTCRGAWKLADRKTSDYHFVIQDDAILCRNFKQRKSSRI